MRILAIESSCDETAAALLNVEKNRYSLEKNIVSSQIAIHSKYGGVVPEVAARNHLVNVIPVLKKAIANKKVDVIAVTAGPGLITSLLVGIETARALSYAWNKPLVAVNHIEGHIYANFLGKFANDKFPIPNIQFLALVLVVSGGHTELVLMTGHGRYTLIGATRDDAVGEAFDKVAKILNLGYPGGPAISREALEGDATAFDLPRPMIDSGDFDFSFSGLKTAVLYLVEKLKNQKKWNEVARKNVCASFQQAAVDVLVSKTICAAEKYKVKIVMLGGGVAANKTLRQHLSIAVKDHLPKTAFLQPSLQYCTDNAAMIAMAAYYHAIKKDFISWKKIEPQPNWKIHEAWSMEHVWKRE